MDLAPEKAAVLHYREQWQNERARLEAILAECNREHHSPPNNYWQDEFRARQRYDVALKVYQVLGGTDHV